ncbi:MAG: DUF6599 family protein [Candidatus Acidiferrales bacterium]
MRRPFLFCLPLLLLTAPQLFAQGILPASVAGWNSTPVFLTGLVPPETPVLKEDGLKATERRTYTRGADRFDAAVYVFGDTEGAYGAYSFLRTPDMPQANLTQHSSMSQNRVLALTGNLLLDFSNVKNRQKDGDAIELIVAQAGGHAKWGAYPALPQRLPAKNFIPRSDHFILGPVALARFLPLASGDWLGFSRGAEAELAHYRLGGHDSTLVVVDYPTPQIAADQLRQWKAQLGVITTGNLATAGNAANANTSGSHLYARRDSTMVALIANAPSVKAANSLLDQFNSGMILTWNTEVLETNQPSMVTIVIGTFVGAGEICAFALLGGVLFAGFRLLIKLLWPGRVFDRAWDLEIIELGLSSRPIKGSDLYQMKRLT